MQPARTCLFAAFAMLAFVARADAQAGPYKLHEMNFDMWCQEERHLPPARCDQRLPQDDAEFEAYMSKIQNYEIQYLQHQRDEDNLNRTILHNDPIDHPVEPSAPVVNQPPPG
jgi:hypothetical protein